MLIANPLEASRGLDRESSSPTARVDPTSQVRASRRHGVDAAGLGQRGSDAATRALREGDRGVPKAAIARGPPNDPSPPIGPLGFGENEYEDVLVDDDLEALVVAEKAAKRRRIEANVNTIPPILRILERPQRVDRKDTPLLLQKQML